MAVARLQRPNMIVQNITTAAIGDVDQTNKIDLVVPCDNATLVQISATTKTAGVGAGTFSLQVMAGASDAVNVAVGPATSATFILAAAVAGIVHGSAFINGFPTQGATGAGGQHLGLKTVKTGAVTTGAVLMIQLFWQI